MTTGTSTVALFLRTAVAPRRLHRLTRSHGTLSSRRFRVRQYEQGLSDLAPVFSGLDGKVSVFLYDNTISNADKLPTALVKQLSSNIQIHATKVNDLGIINKGAGDIQAWIQMRELLSRFDFVFQYNPRMRLKHPDLLLRFISARAEFVAQDFRGGARTGYFCLSSERLYRYVDSIDLSNFVSRSTSIEDSMEAFLKSDGMDLSDIPPLGIRFAGRKDRGHPY